MKPLVKSINWLDIAIIGFVIFVIVWGDFKHFGSNSSLMLLLPFMVIVTVFAFFLKVVGIIGRIGSDDRMNLVNWINFGMFLLAYSLITNLAQVAFHDYPSGYWAIIRYSLAGAVIIGTAIYFYKSWKRKNTIAIDERTSEVTNRSARNALAATWFGLLLVAGSPVLLGAEVSPSALGVDPYNVSKLIVAVLSDNAIKTLVVVIIAVLIFLLSSYIYRKQEQRG